jgi:hypothetical protein
MSQRLSASMSCASFSLRSFLAMAGASPPALLVEKKMGSIRSKSPLGLHAVHQHRADHAAPADEAHKLPVFICYCAFQTKWICSDLPGSSGSGGGAHDEPKAGQPFLVIVVLVYVHTPPAGAARAVQIGEIGRVHGERILAQASDAAARVRQSSGAAGARCRDHGSNRHLALMQQAPEAIKTIVIKSLLTGLCAPDPGRGRRSAPACRRCSAQGLDHSITHFARAHPGGAFAPDVGRAQALGQHLP